MTDELRQRARRIFMELAERPQTERQAALEAACAGDSALRAEVETLLRFEAQAGGFMASPTGNILSGDAPTLDASSREVAATVIRGLREGPGSRIGPYKLLQHIGEGGFGSVFMAEQERPIARKVALKIIKLGMDTAQVVARFEAERQALAILDHPGIAKVFDAGATETGRPYFVMELCTGEPIDAYCDRHNLSIHDRLDLFAQVCQAVQHAHTKGIIHRDIKPSNVLVHTQDGRPHAKVIDFGIAKATNARLTEKTLFTEHKQIIGTPEYMSPEQAEGSLDIDTRTDVYALGVLLYELLTGSTPFSARDLRSAAYAEIQRIIREVDPPNPSTRLAQDSDTLATVAARRQSEPRRLGSMVRGELDWIVMKSLEKDRQRRYESASGLAADIRRYLAGEDVLAAPPSRVYKARKFVRRHRMRVIAGGLLLTSLLLGLASTTWQAIRAEHARAAEARQREVAQANERLATAAAESERLARLDAQTKRREAETNLEYARTGNQILGSVFRELNPAQSYATAAELRSALQANLGKAIEQLDGSSIGDPLVVAQMQITLGQSLLSLGAARQAVPLLNKARDTRQARLGPDHRQTLDAMQLLAAAYQHAGNLDLALPLAEETYQRRKTALGADDPDTTQSMQTLAGLYSYARRLDEAVAMGEEVLRLRKSSLGPEHPDTVAAMGNLALIYGMAERHGSALPLLEDVVRLQRARLGPDHPGTLAAMGGLANAYKALGQLDKAVPLYEETLRLQRTRLGRDHPGTLVSMGNLAVAYEAIGKPDLALLLFEETFKLREAMLGPDHPETIGAMNHLAGANWAAGNRDTALQLYERALEIKRTKFGADHRDTLGGMTHLASLYQAAGNPQRAVQLYEEAIRLKRAKLGPGDAETLNTMRDLATLFTRQQDFASAEPWLRQLLAVQLKSQPDNWTTFSTQCALGGVLLNQKKYAEAETLLLNGYDGLKQRAPTIPPEAARLLPQTIDDLLELYRATNRPALAKPWQDERARYSTAPGSSDPR